MFKGGCTKNRAIFFPFPRTTTLRRKFESRGGVDDVNSEPGPIRSRLDVWPSVNTVVILRYEIYPWFVTKNQCPIDLDRRVVVQFSCSEDGGVIH